MLGTVEKIDIAENGEWKKAALDQLERSQVGRDVMYNDGKPATNKF